MLDYIIVGAGLAGISFAEKLRKVNKSFVVIDSGAVSASTVAAGIYNPIVLKRLRMVDDAGAFLDAMHKFYDGLSVHFSTEFRTPIPIYRRLASTEEQNDWSVAADLFPAYLCSEVIDNTHPKLYAPYGYGLVYQSGWVNTIDLISCYRNFLQHSQLLRVEAFAYEQLSFSSEVVIYKDIQARHIVFAEGIAMAHNPFFNYLPIQKTKGEIITVCISKLELHEMINSSIFIMPLGDALYKVGATYNWRDISEGTTDSAREELCKKLDAIINVPYKVIKQEAGFRPTVSDRKPLLGTHPIHKRLHVINGMGSRGVLLAPLCADWLFNNIEFGDDIPAKMNISRFAGKFLGCSQ